MEDRKRIEKLIYMHRNPVMRGLVQAPEQWPWSSYRSYAYGEEGAVRINQWDAAHHENPDAGCMSPHLCKKRKGGPPAESNLDYFEARFYSSGLGRFLTARLGGEGYCCALCRFR